jgi:hypothetical protein
MRAGLICGFCAGRWEYTYAILSGSVLLISLFRSFLFFNIALKAGTRMHNAMAHRCLPTAGCFDTGWR